MRIILICIFLFVNSLSVYAQYSVVVSKSNSNVAELSAKEIKDIYTYDVRTWKDGSKIVPYDLKSDSARDKFCGFLGVTYTDFKKTWMKLQLAGEAKAPEALGSDDEVISKITQNPNAIGFISSDKVNENVKVVAVIK